MQAYPPFLPQQLQSQQQRPTVLTDVIGVSGDSASTLENQQQAERCDYDLHLLSVDHIGGLAIALLQENAEGELHDGRMKEGGCDTPTRIDGGAISDDADMEAKVEVQRESQATLVDKNEASPITNPQAGIPQRLRRVADQRQR